MSKTLFLLNPSSNEGKAQSISKKIQTQFPELDSPIDIRTISNLSEYLKESNPELVIIGGGDGTINSVCNAIINVSRKPNLAILPLGYGNALSYCFGVETIEKAISVIKQQKHKITIDLLKTNIPQNPIGVFNIGIGFDARIVHNRMNHRYIGIRSYVISTIKSLFTHPENEITFTIDKKMTLKATASSLVVANCPIIGQNYVISPQARLNDGLLDCTLFSTKYAYITNLRMKGFKHPLYSELGKMHFKASHVRIEGEPYVQIDGDPLVHQEVVEIEVLPNQVTFLRNDQQNIDQYYQPFIT